MHLPVSKALRTAALLLAVALFCVAVVWAQEPEQAAEAGGTQPQQTVQTPVIAPEPEIQPEAPAAAGVSANRSDAVRRALATLLQSMNRNQEALNQLQQALDQAQDDEEKKAIQQRIDAIQKSLAEQRENLTEIASGISSESFGKPQTMKFDWKAELGELLAPLVQQMKDLTARPREIEQLRSEIGRRSEVLAKAESALKRIEGLMAEAKDPAVLEYLQKEKQRWETLAGEFRDAREVARIQLEQTLSESKSITESLSSIFQQFFSSRGLNLLLAIVAFVVVFFIMRLVHRKLVMLLFRNKAGETSFTARITNILVGMLGTLLAITAALGVFYAAGDWVLLGISLILILGVIWSAKTGVSKYWEHVKLLLNVGGVREGERLLIGGVPYRVETIRYYTTLYNPELTGGRIRVTIDELVGKCSRPFEPEEPFFPCSENDYVLVGGNYGKVLRQTPEFVQLELLSGSVVCYTTSSFVASTPLNVSTGYTVAVTFGVDYKHQQDAVSRIPEVLQQDVAAAFAATDIAPHVAGVSVSFKEAAASSLDFSIFVSLKHEAATWYYSAGRLVQRTAVESCIRNGWEIPFPQMTIHQPDRQ